MKTREEVLDTLRQINVEWDDPGLTTPESCNLDAGAVMLLWLLGWEQRLWDVNGEGALMHSSIRHVVTEVLLMETL